MEAVATKKKSRHFDNFSVGIWKQNPLLVSLLGTCPALAVTTSVENSIGMGVLFTFVLVCSNLLISALRKLIPEEAETPCYIVIIAAFVTIVKMLTEAYVKPLYDSLGIFLSLLVVNCIVLGRAEAFANKNSMFDSLLDGIGNGIGFTVALVIIAAFREILGTGMLTYTDIFSSHAAGETAFSISLPILRNDAAGYDFSMSLMTNPAGGFIAFGIIIAIISAFRIHKENKVKIEARKALAQRQALAKAKKDLQAKQAAASQQTASLKKDPIQPIDPIRPIPVKPVTMEATAVGEKKGEN